MKSVAFGDIAERKEAEEVEINALDCGVGCLADAGNALKLVNVLHNQQFAEKA